MDGFNWWKRKGVHSKLWERCWQKLPIVADQIANGNIPADPETKRYTEADENRKKAAVEIASQLKTPDLDRDGKVDVGGFKKLVQLVDKNHYTILMAKQVSIWKEEEIEKEKGEQFIYRKGG